MEKGKLGRLSVPAAVDGLLLQMINLLLDRHIGAWFSDLTTDESVMEDCKYQIKFAVTNIVKRVKGVDLRAWIAGKAASLVVSHLEAYARASRMLPAEHRTPAKTAALALLQLRGRHHIALESDGRYVQEILDRVMPKLLLPASTDCPSLHLIVRELLVSVVLRPTIEVVTKPHFITTMLLDSLVPPPDLKVPQMDDAGKVPTPLLGDVEPPQSPESAFQTSVRAILSDPLGLLQPFQKYLVEIGRIDEFMCYRELDELILEYGDASIMTDMARRQEYNKVARRIYDTLINPELQTVLLPKEICDPVKEIFDNGRLLPEPLELFGDIYREVTCRFVETCSAFTSTSKYVRQY